MERLLSDEVFESVTIYPADVKRCDDIGRLSKKKKKHKVKVVIITNNGTKSNTIGYFKVYEIFDDLLGMRVGVRDTTNVDHL